MDIKSTSGTTARLALCCWTHQGRAALGGAVVYAVDAASHPLVRVELPTWGYARMLGDFREENGFVLPHRTWSPSDSSEVTIPENLVVNAELDGGRFQLPRGIR